MDEHHSLCGLELLGMSVGIVEPLAMKDDARAMAFGLRDLHRRGADGHDDGHRNAEAPAMISDGLRVVSRGSSDNAARALAFVQRKQFVERAAFLIGCSELQIFELQPMSAPVISTGSGCAGSACG
jgi:hypothetical protein